MQVKVDKVKELERRIVLTEVDHIKGTIVQGAAGSGYDSDDPFISGQLDGLLQALSIVGGIPGEKRRDFSRLLDIARRVARWDLRWAIKYGYDPEFSELDIRIARIGIKYLDLSANDASRGHLFDKDYMEQAMTEVYREDASSGG